MLCFQQLSLIKKQVSTKYTIEKMLTASTIKIIASVIKNEAIRKAAERVDGDVTYMYIFGYDAK